MRTLTDSLRWARLGTSALDEIVSGTGIFGVTDWDADCALPGWTHRHLGAHLAANADALGNLVRWAATGEATPMYSSPEQRNADIALGSQRPVADIVGWFTASSAALFEAMAALTPDQWQSPVVTAQGRTVPATDIPWMRAREVCIHAVDMGTGFTFADLPDDFLRALIDDVVAKRGAQESRPGITLSAGEQSWTLGDGAVDVKAFLPDLAAYLTGRTELAQAPTLGAWL